MHESRSRSLHTAVLAAVVAAATAAVLAAPTTSPACPLPVDQRNLSSTASVVVSEEQVSGQTLTVGVTGQIIGIELAPLLGSTDPSALIHMDVYDDADLLLGTATRPANGFELGDDITPDIIAEDAIGYGYFDVSGLGIDVVAGQSISFVVRHSQVGVCDGMSSLCSAGKVGDACSGDGDCVPQIHLGVRTTNPYAGGAQTIDGALQPGNDLAFKTIVARDCTECGEVPLTGCRGSETGGSSILLADDADDDGRDQLSWKFSRGDATPKAAFGDPATSSTVYAFCVYDAAGLLAGATLPAATDWTEKRTGFTYKLPMGAGDGISTVKLKEGLVDGSTKISVRGKGVDLEMPALDLLSSPLTVQLVNDDDQCWSTSFSFAATPDAARFKDSSD